MELRNREYDYTLNEKIDCVIWEGVNKMEKIKLKKMLKELKNSKDWFLAEEQELIILFNGGHSANVYDFNGDEVDYFSFGDFSKNQETKKEFRKAVKNYINSLNY